MTTRPHVARPLLRAVHIEAGHRCAVPTCRQTSGLEVHHIDNWAKVQEHKLENLILLCAVCHSRATKGEIDRLSMRAYKQNLLTMSGRYGDLERRVLDYFVRHPSAETIVVDRSHELLLMYLVEDRLLSAVGPGNGAICFSESGRDEPAAGDILLGPMIWRLTDEGQAIVAVLRSARVLE